MNNEINHIHNLISQNYILENFEIKFLRESSDNKVFLITSNEKSIAIIRISKRDIKEDLLFEINGIDQLYSQQVPVTKIIKTKENESYIEINSKICVLFQFIEGFHVNLATEVNKNEYIKEGAKALAKLHSVLPLDISNPRSRNIFTELNRIIENKDEFIVYFKNGTEFVTLVEEYINWGKGQKFEETFIHNDYRIDNIIFGENKVNAIIDFDWSCMGPVIKDLGLALIEWSFDREKGIPNMEVFDLFLNSYNSVAKETVSKDKLLYKWICFATLSDTATYLIDRINQKNKIEISDSYMYKKLLYFQKLL